MKVLQVGLSYNPGGIENFVMTYYRALVRKGVQFDFVCTHEKLAFQEEIERLGGRIFYLPNGKKQVLKFSEAYKKLLRREKYDIVHVNMLTAANILPLSLAYRVGVPRIIAHSHNSDTEFWYKKLLHVFNKRKVGKYATDFFACSEAAAAWLFPKRILRAGNYKIVPNAIRLSDFQYDPDSRRQYREMLGIPEQSFLVCHVGRMEPQKNHGFLLDIFRALRERCPEACLLLVGDGYLMPSVKEKAQSLGILDGIRFPGRRSDIPSLLNASDVFCLPSLFEGFGIVAVEAQAAGLPCVVSDTVPEDVRFTERCVRMPLSADPADWADRLLAFRSETRDEACVAAVQKQIRDRGFDIESEIHLYD